MTVQHISDHFINRLHRQKKALSHLSALACAVILCMGMIPPAGHAAELPLAQTPAGNGGREPPPNVIVSIDDSGSMGFSLATGGTRMEALKAALRDSFSRTKIPDDAIRVGFQAMWRCRDFGPGATADYGGACPENRVRSFSGSHRSGFDTWVESLEPASGTPSHRMVLAAGNFMKTTGLWSPYASVPGTTEEPVLACRKSFHIFMTDGEWNTIKADIAGTDNWDGTSRTLPDGTFYDTSSGNTQSRIYRDAWGGATNSFNTLSDLVFEFWATDLQSGIADKVKPNIREPGPIDVGTSGTPYVIEEYWNPTNNPATWQSLATYTIGFGDDGVLSATEDPKWTGEMWDGEGYLGLLRGTVTWETPHIGGDSKRKELWHAAINGRGRYIPAGDQTELTNAFTEIINQVIRDTSTPPVSSVASNTQTLSDDTRVYTAGYHPTQWRGFVQARKIGGRKNNLDELPLWDAATVLDNTPATSRLIFTHNGTAGTAFEWSNLSAAQQNLIKGSDAAAVGESRLNYLRGVRTGEQANGGDLRDRATKLGDIVNSNLWVVGKPDIGYSFENYKNFRSDNASRTTMIYVGANDGMLHGFNAADGSEKMAYVPSGVYAKLKSYTDPSYAHAYTVDGHPFTGDVYDGSNWKTMLVGTLAGGGKGYFVLDVTNPAGWSSTSGASLVFADKTDGSDADIGHIYGEPTVDTINRARAVQITKLNDGRWAVLMGNGVNSSSEKAVLLIQYLDGAKELRKIVLDNTGGNGNGLANPQVIDINGDGTADVAYAGDLLGNLWKIDLSNSTAANWRSYFRTGTTPTPLFVARDAYSARQPIVTAPQWAPHPIKGIMLAFGTGREMTVADRVSTSTQTLYSVWDDTEFTPSTATKMNGGTVIANGRSDLVAQTQTSAVTINGKNYFKTSNNAVTYTGSGAKRGWYMEWPNAGERAVNNGGMVSARLLFTRSRVPPNGTQDALAGVTCDKPDVVQPTEYLTIMDIVNGKPPAKPVFDTDGGGMTGSEESGVTRWESGRGDQVFFRTGKLGEWISMGGDPGNDGSRCPKGKICTTKGPGGNPLKLTGFGWRQLQ
jgi:type IV pilus assembly protein PilY1